MIAFFESGCLPFLPVVYYTANKQLNKVEQSTYGGGGSGGRGVLAAGESLLPVAFCDFLARRFVFQGTLHPVELDTRRVDSWRGAWGRGSQA